MRRQSIIGTLVASLCFLSSVSRAGGTETVLTSFNFDDPGKAFILQGFSNTPKLSPIPVPLETNPTRSVIVPPGLWNSLKAPDETSLEIIEASFPQWNTSTIHEVPLKAAEAMLAEGVRQKMSALDFFTDPAWQGPHSYYFSQETLSKVMARYNLHSLIPVNGQDVDGLPFHMQMALIGNGRIVMFMDQDGFNFTNPDYASFQYHGHPFTFDGDRIIIEEIIGPGDLRISGLRVNVTVNTLIHPSLPIVEAKKISATKQHIQTSLGGGDAPLLPIALRTMEKKP